MSADGSSCYVQTTAIDALSHQHITYTDPFGQLTYDDRFTGNSGGTYALYALTHYAYDFNGHLVTITHPNNSTTTTFAYDLAGRKTSQSDPDLGTTTYGYDADGNLTQMVDARGAGGTVYAGYDGFDRLLWRNTTNSPTWAPVT